jgi:hypothetical protein
LLSPPLETTPGSSSARPAGRSSSAVAALALAAACALASPLAHGQLIGGDLQKRVNSVIALMGYMLTPDVTTGALAISNAGTGNPEFGMTTAGGGFTLSRGFPLYLEGTLGYARYDPTFAVDNGQVTGSVAASVNLWSRWRAPTGITLLQRPLRYVLEFAHTTFLGDLDGVLGFNDLSSLGTGLELDSSAYDVTVTRTRLMARYQVGEHVRGWSLGLAVSF